MTLALAFDISLSHWHTHLQHSS